jgi:hypothetical protein
MWTVVGERSNPATTLTASWRLARLHLAWIERRPVALENPTREGWWEVEPAPASAPDSAGRR